MKNKTIEIPFGAKDSELKGWEYTIPENMEAEIKDGKIIVKQKESEDERIRKEMVDYFSQYKEDGIRGIDITPWIAYLERQKEQDKCPEVCVRSHCIGCSIYEKHNPVLEEYLKATPAERRKMSMTGILEKEHKLAEWSEEDEKMRNNLIELLIRLSAKTRTDSTSINYSYPREIDWLKSLRPQPHWKPSEEQISALERAIVKMHTPDDISILAELRDILKKL